MRQEGKGQRLFRLRNVVLKRSKAEHALGTGGGVQVRVDNVATAWRHALCAGLTALGTVSERIACGEHAGHWRHAGTTSPTARPNKSRQDKQGTWQKSEDDTRGNAQRRSLTAPTTPTIRRATSNSARRSEASNRRCSSSRRTASRTRTSLGSHTARILSSVSVGASASRRARMACCTTCARPLTRHQSCCCCSPTAAARTLARWHQD